MTANNLAQNANQLQALSLIKLGACLLYECLVIIAIAFIGVATFVMLFGNATEGTKRILLQCFIWLLIGFYFVLSWVKRGQTLPMRSWKLMLIHQKHSSESAALINVYNAMLRYILATLGLSIFGLGFFWCLFDKDSLFLHDRILHNKLIILSAR